SHRKLHSELEENVNYKLKQESLDRSQTDLKKLRRKGHTKHSSKYDLKENEMDMQRFIAEGCREALLEEKRRFWFLAEKHCMFSYQLSNFHEKVNNKRRQTSHAATFWPFYFPSVFSALQAKDILRCRLPTWQEKCSNIDQVPDTVATIIEGLSTDPEQSAQVERFNKGSLEEGNLSRSASVSSDLNVGRKSRVKTIFPHTAGNNNTLLSFDHGDIITLLIHEEKDGWLYGELEKTQQ
ncbi:hypothetical protein GOODEAATRI_008807, partial [Goodea atripinnis]